MSRYDHEHLGAWRYDLEPGRQCPVLLIGEDNPRSADPKYALYPYPIGCAGYNLSENILDVGLELSIATWRTNLCSPTWSRPAAVLRMSALAKPDADVPWGAIVMLGRRVAEAYAGVSGRLLDSFRTFTDSDSGINVIALPHPSGRCRDWNDASAKFRARELLAREVPEWYGHLGNKQPSSRVDPYDA